MQRGGGGCPNFGLLVSFFEFLFLFLAFLVLCFYILIVLVLDLFMFHGKLHMRTTISGYIISVSSLILAQWERAVANVGRSPIKGNLNHARPGLV